MKLTVIGGGGVRTPEFVRGALHFVRDLDLQEIWLMDVAADRLAIVAELARRIMYEAGGRCRIFTSTHLDDALRDADAIVTAVRVGGEAGRIRDERVALDLGVLGQETTGPGGFAMAMRSIPALIAVAERAEALAPRAWMFNFTNPAGLVAQGLHRAGFPRAVGICDSANTAQHAVAAWLNEPVDRVKTEVFGLNHLSWARSARVAGHDRLPELLADDGFVAATHLRLFGPEWVRRTGLFANEYLYYYDFRDHALRDILAAEETRGEQIARMSEALFASLAGRPGAQMMAAYNAYHRERDAGYLAHQGAQAEQDAAGGAAVGGYAGVALRTLLAVHADRPLRIALNVPNGASIAGLAADDVVEVTCTVDRRGPQPIAIGEMPPGPRALVFAVKTYERLAIEAIEARSRARAVEALVAHPLVGSVSLATALVEGYLRAHAETVGTWGP